MMKKNKSTMRLVIALGVLFIVTNQTRAGIVDLTEANSSGSINDALFVWTNFNSTGTGVIDPFIRIKTNDDIEQGYNTDYRSKDPVYPEFNEEANPLHNHSLLLSRVPVVNIGGTDYREFLLDINQNGNTNGRYLSLDELEIYVANSGSLYGYPNLGTLIYDMDEGLSEEDALNNYVLLNYKLNNGSGSGDMFAYIPSNLFVGGSYVYLYSKLGVNNPNTADFEEWSIRLGDNTTQVPVPGAFVLGMLGLIAAGKKLRKYA